MAKKQKSYTPEFKQQIVDLRIRSTTYQTKRKNGIAEYQRLCRFFQELIIPI